MKKVKYFIGLAALVCILATAACTQQKTTTEEQVEITTMDSSATKAKEVSAKLEAQTKEVEASIEKMDKEFSTNN